MKTVLDCSTSKFWDELKDVISSVKPLFLIDAVGNECSGKCFELMPPNSEMILLGSLANENLKICTTELFMHNKRIRGFNLERYIEDEVTDDRRK